MRFINSAVCWSTTAKGKLFYTFIILFQNFGERVSKLSRMTIT